MNQFYFDVLEQPEKSRVELLEPFDEFEVCDDDDYDDDDIKNKTQIADIGHFGVAQGTGASFKF